MFRDLADEGDNEPPRAERSAGVRRPLRSLWIPLLLAPLAAGAYSERIILALEAGSCTLRLEADDEARSLRLRVVPESSTCRVSREDVQRLLREAFSRTDPPKLEGRYSSLFIGRLVDFPWLSSYLASAASQDARWDKTRGKPVGIGINQYVAALLSRREVATQLESAIQASGYRIGSARVEKVLVGRWRDVGGRGARASAWKVPFDAMVWFRLEQRQPGPEPQGR